MSGAAFAALAVLAGVGALTLVVVVRRNQALRRRPGDVPVRVRCRKDGPWVPGHGVWVNDVFAFRRSPAGWRETLLWIMQASACGATEEEREQLARLHDPVIATFELASGGTISVAASAGDRARLLGPFAWEAPTSAAAASLLGTPRL